MSRKFRNILDSESDHEPTSEWTTPTGTAVDRLNTLVGRCSSIPRNATINSQQNTTTLASSPSTRSPSPFSKDNCNVNDYTSVETKLVKDTNRIFYRPLILTVDVTAVISVVARS